MANRAELRGNYNRRRCLVFPSIEEGSASVIPEAIVASHESGASTQVSDGCEGFIVSPQDTERLAQIMMRVARDTEFNRRMGEAAHKKGAVKDTWQDYGDRLLATCQQRLQAREASK